MARLGRAPVRVLNRGYSLQFDQSIVRPPYRAESIRPTGRGALAAYSSLGGTLDV